MQRCNVPPELLVAYADDYLTRDRNELIEAHIQTCRQCRERLARFADVDDLIRENSPPIDDPAARVTILARVEAMGTDDPFATHSVQNVRAPFPSTPALAKRAPTRQGLGGRMQWRLDAFMEPLKTCITEATKLRGRQDTGACYVDFSRVRLIVGSLLAMLIFTGAAFAIVPIVEQALEQNPGTRRIIDLDLGQEVELAQTVNDFTVTVKRVYADPNEIVIGYSISGPSGREFANFHPFELTDSTAPTLTDAQGHQYPEAPLSWGAGLEAEAGGYVDAFDATSIVGTPEELQLRLDIHALTAIERVDDGVDPAYPTGSVCEPGICRFTVPGPFTFDLTIPFEPGRTAELHQKKVVNGTSVTLERVATTPTGTRIDLRGAGPDADVELRVGGATYTLRSSGAIPSYANADAVWAYTTSESLMDEDGEWTVVVTTGDAAANTPPVEGEPRSQMFHFSFALP